MTLTYPIDETFVITTIVLICLLILAIVALIVVIIKVCKKDEKKKTKADEPKAKDKDYGSVSGVPEDEERKV